MNNFSVNNFWCILCTSSLFYISRDLLIHSIIATSEADTKSLLCLRSSIDVGRTDTHLSFLVLVSKVPTHLGKQEKDVTS